MCGIAGFLNLYDYNGKFAEIMDGMTDSMAHRGPDDRACVLVSDKPVVFLGHRRLSIIDLTARARQPMTSHDGLYTIVFNGEIYNYIELKETLKTKGCRFSSDSDTEVILEAYRIWGVDCFSHFNGMWALAIWDSIKQRLILSRDRLGKKPLYYYRSGNEMVFASEIKALLKHPEIKASPNYEKVFKYLAYNYRYLDIDEQSYFDAILQVPKSSCMVIDRALNIQTFRYWDLKCFLAPKEVNETTAVNEFRDLFIDAVRLRLRSDVPVGCMLSGGMDSTSITCVAYKVLGQPIMTFSGVTGDVKGVYDESEYIDSVVRTTNADHSYLKPNPTDLFETVKEMLAFHDEPICTVTWYSLYLIARKISEKRIPVILNGHGGDELLAGYWDHYNYNFYDLEMAGDLARRNYEINCWQDNHGRDPGEIERTRRYIQDLYHGQASEMQRFPDYSHCFTPSFADVHKKVISFPMFQDSTSLNRRLYIETLFDGVPTVLRPEDRNTMAHSIESRSPFLDYRLIEYCLGLPNHFKIRNGLGKWLLREAMRGILPEDVRTRKDKAGFIAPADEWFRTVNRGQIEGLLESPSLAARGIFEVEELKEIFSEHLSGGKNHQMFLWQLINLDLWFRIFFERMDLQ